jgi:hypothetical protein
MQAAVVQGTYVHGMKEIRMHIVGKGHGNI